MDTEPNKRLINNTKAHDKLHPQVGEKMSSALAACEEIHARRRSRISSSSSSQPHHYNSTQHAHYTTQEQEKSKAEILEVKRKAISLLTTAYKTDTDEKVDELEAQLRDLLHMIRPEDLPANKTNEEATTTAASAATDANAVKDPTRPIAVPPSSAFATSTPTPDPAPTQSGVLLRDFNGRNPLQSHIGEIQKPMKQFHAQNEKIMIADAFMKKGMVAGMQQGAFLEAAMGRDKSGEHGWMGFSLWGNYEGDEDDSISEMGIKEFGEMGGKGLRKHKPTTPKRRQKRRSSKGNHRHPSISDSFAGMMIVTKGVHKSTASSISSNSFDSEDDVSTLGTEPTYESSSISERMTGFLRVRRLPTTAEEKEPSGEATKENGGALQDIAEDETVETPSRWRWFQPLVAQPQAVPA